MTKIYFYMKEFIHALSLFRKDKSMILSRINYDFNKFAERERKENILFFIDI